MNAILTQPDVTEPGQRWGWQYASAFCRNRGLITEAEQQRLRGSRVAIAGLGGVGGVHLLTLARLGVQRFCIADLDTFELANLNRQAGASLPTLGRPKTEVMAELAREINPEVELRVFGEGIASENVGDFLDGADLLVDGLDLFAIGIRRALFRAAAASGIHAVTAGPVGFSSAWLVFDPNGMSFDRYFDLTDQMNEVEQILAFLVGSSPSATQLAYMDLDYMSLHEHIAPSTAAGCQLAAGVMGAEAVKILLRRGRIWPAPYYQQFDAYTGRYIRRRLWGGNRHPYQRLKRWWLYRQYQLGKAGWARSNSPASTQT